MLTDAPYGLALSAGVLAAVNPCGFALLPAYVSLLVTGDDPADTPTPGMALRRALTLTAAMTAGFVAVFGTFGLLAAPAADWLANRLPWVTVAIGILLAGLGGWLAAGRELPSPVPKLSRAPKLSRGVGSLLLFGMSFAVASLGCTIGPFLGVVVASFATGSVAQGVGLFVAYAAGMALVVGAIAVAVAVARQSVVTWMRRTASVLSRTAGALMFIAGIYVAWYGWYEIRIQADPTTTDLVVDTAGQIQRTLAAALDRAGPAGIAIATAVLCAVIAALALRRRRARSG
ncbi:cytochrome c biogenesis CcdA family protein [Actinoplanes friuliensis]|uniref:Cytochrome c biogenesis protein, transmembrane region n=1 Tax=Actinoplanes friuliensis DSM 7358 TaxID=1246995 RepID=U5VYH1_9ACTN|nr:cytochrome c biogenesis CcdA family protein [Actinoplanes friuliensis]AGZ40760.1 cytochrome c biogenesis protein, transmembrane region [Actinoplanes friuliensis DSM 7358]